MNSNTRIFLYGDLKYRKEIEEEFDWYKILKSSEEFCEDEHNSGLFHYYSENVPFANIKTERKVLMVHPGGQDLWDKVKMAVEQAATRYYSFILSNAYCKVITENYSKVEIHIFSVNKNEYNGLKRGSIITYGSYPQGPNGEIEPIRWIVIDINEKNVQLLSEKALIQCGYCDLEKLNNSKNKQWFLEWSNSLSRQVLNVDFYEDAFTSIEKENILSQFVPVLNGPECKDKVVLLSEGAVEVLLKKEGRTANPTEYLKLNSKINLPRAYEDYTDDKDDKENFEVPWWILPEEKNKYAVYPKYVNSRGIKYHSRNIGHSDFTLRPCICIKLPNNNKYSAEEQVEDKSEKNLEHIVSEYSAENKKESITEQSIFKKLMSIFNQKDSSIKNSNTSNKVKSEEKKLSDKISSDKVKLSEQILNKKTQLIVDGGEAYSLDYIKQYKDKPMNWKPGEKSSEHMVSINKWRLRICLDKEGIWYLSIFRNENGTFDRFSLDCELEHDSHYEFKNEKGIRAAIYQPGDENKYLAEIFINYVNEKNGFKLLSELGPYITARFSY